MNTQLGFTLCWRVCATIVCRSCTCWGKRVASKPPLSHENHQAEVNICRASGSAARRPRGFIPDEQQDDRSNGRRAEEHKTIVGSRLVAAAHRVAGSSSQQKEGDGQKAKQHGQRDVGTQGNAAAQAHRYNQQGWHASHGYGPSRPKSRGTKSHIDRTQTAHCLPTISLPFRPHGRLGV